MTSEAIICRSNNASQHVPGGSKSGFQTPIAIVLIISLGLAIPGRLLAQTPGDVEWGVWEPRVMHVDRTEPVTFKTVVLGNPIDLTIALKNGDDVILEPIGNDTYQATLTMAQILHNYQAGADHNHVGFLEVPGPCRPQTGGCQILTVNIRTETTPEVTIFELAPDAQASEHVLNLHYDTLLSSATPLEPLLRFYELFPDDFDFIGVVEQVNYPTNRFYRGMKNDTLGIGREIFDIGFHLGLPPRLRGVIHFPIDYLFDLALWSNLHEIGHRWIKYLDHPSLQAGGAHWPLSDLAYSIMGYSPANGQGLSFPYELIEQPDGNYLVNQVELATEFHDFDLYLMGLLSPSETGEHFVFQDQDQQARNGQLLLGPVDLITIDDVIAVEGPRIPASSEAQTDFRIATIVLSRGGLLSSNEMAFFEYMAARGEATSELPYNFGFGQRVTKPFYLATGGRATLSSTIISDSDGDTVPDGADNCPVIANTNQRDADRDGIGNACEPIAPLALADLNSNGSPEVAMLVRGSTHVHIRDGSTDALISDIDFGADDALQMLVLPDLDASGDPEIAVLNEQASGHVRVQIRDSVTGAIVKNLYYGLQYRPVSMDVVSDYSGNGFPEIAVVGSEAGTDAVRVQIRDSSSNAFVDNVFLGTQSIAHDVVSLTDTSGNGIPEMGILGVLKANDQVRMQIWDADTSAFQSNVWFAKVYQPHSTITMPDINGNGSDEIVAVGVDPVTQNIRVQVRDSLTTATLRNIWLGAVNEAIDIKLINDINSNGFADLAILLKTPGGTGRVRIQDGSTGAFIRNLFFSVVENPVGLAVLPDYSGNGFEELAALGENAGIRHVQILDTNTGLQVNRIDFP